MADHGWRNDNRHWDERQRGRYQAGRNSGRGSYGQGSYGDDDWRGSQQDFGRESEYGAGYASPRDYGDLSDRPGGMRDQNWSRDRDDWNQGWSGRQGGMGRQNYGGQNYGNPGYGARGDYSDYNGSYGSGPSDYQDYGDWQGQGSIGYGTMGTYGGPRFGSNYPGNRDTYGRGYGNYGGGNYGGDSGRGYSPSGRDYGDDRWTNRNLWNRATDEVASWVGDDEAGQRRNMDRMRSHAGRGPKGYTRSDDRIREDVNDRLTDDWQLDASNIDATVNNGEVTLSGTVDDIEDKHRAERIIENLSGVKHVQNNLRVDNSSHNNSTAGQSASVPVGSSGQGTSAYSASPRSSSPTQPSSNGGTSH